MYYIALKMLFGDRGKYIGMVVGLSFAALIMTQQPSIFLGLLTRTYSFVNDISLPDIWVMDPGVQFVEEHKPLRDTDLSRVRGVSGVKWAVPMYKNLMRAKLPDGSTKIVDLTGLDDATLVGAPYRILQGDITDFRRADAVFVDIEAAKTRLKVHVGGNQYRPLAVGDTIEINDRRAMVIGYIKTTRNFVLQPQVYTTYSRALTYSQPDRRQMTYILVKAKDDYSHEQLARKLEEVTGLKVATAEEFRSINFDYWMKNTGIPINFGISVLLGFIVGAAVAGQTFYNFVQENLKHYAALKAMGLHNMILAKMVMLQALVVGIIGYGIGVGITVLFGLRFHDAVLAFRMPPGLLLFSGVGILIIVMLAALIGIRRVITVDPSIVFRS
ncbi:MAG TPA: FtsX-like permease family protein [Candidatus Nitrosotenuis sp.]|nr:FtsX-like permease family protein [Candidatus Nitrosotenuis sp.]